MNNHLAVHEDRASREGVEEFCCPWVIRCVSNRNPEENTEEASNNLGRRITEIK